MLCYVMLSVKNLRGSVRRLRFGSAQFRYLRANTICKKNKEAW